MAKRLSCPACSTAPAVHNSKAIISPWVRELAGVSNRVTSYFICANCGTGWADINYSPEQMQNLYNDYRGAKYLEIRQKWESTYTSEFNSSIDGGHDHMELRQSQMLALISEYSSDFAIGAKSVLDIGGGHGSLIPNWPNLNAKYVLDVSGVSTLDGITQISNWSELPQGQKLNLVMACGILEHLTSPNDFLGKMVSEIRQNELLENNSLFYFEVPAGVPIRKKDKLKYFFSLMFSFKQKSWKMYDRLLAQIGRENFPMRIAEHIQFFTPSGMEALLQRSGFEYVGSKTYSASESLIDSQSLRFGNILGVVARIPNSVI